MNVIFDTICSALIGGLILISVHSLNANLSNSASAKMVTTGVQQSMAQATRILEYDLRKVGYNNFASSHFKLAESTRVWIRADFDGNGSPDSVYYFLGTSPDPVQRNPRARVLYRQYNTGPPVAMRLGITRLRFRYYDGAGTPLATAPGVANPGAIRGIRTSISMDVGSIVETKRLANGTVKNDTTFSSASWEKMMKPVNLK